MAHKEPAVKRWKYIFVKPFLDDTINSLAKWQLIYGPSLIYDPSWYLIMLVANPLIDQELQRKDAMRSSEGAAVMTTARQVRSALRGEIAQTAHLKLSSTGLENASTSSIPFSSARHMERPGKTGFIVDSIHCLQGAYLGDINKDVRTLAKKLQCADPSTFGVLRCRGVA